MYRVCIWWSYSSWGQVPWFWDIVSILQVTNAGVRRPGYEAMLVYQDIQGLWEMHHIPNPSYCFSNEALSAWEWGSISFGMKFHQPGNEALCISNEVPTSDEAPTAWEWGSNQGWGFISLGMKLYVSAWEWGSISLGMRLHQPENDTPLLTRFEHRTTINSLWDKKKYSTVVWTIVSVDAMVSSLQGGSRTVHIARHSTCSACDLLDVPTTKEGEQWQDLGIHMALLKVTIQNT